jgi:hypothetical protein
MYDLCFLTGHFAVAVTPAESSRVFCDLELCFLKKKKKSTERWQFALLEELHSSQERTRNRKSRMPNLLATISSSEAPVAQRIRSNSLQLKPSMGFWRQGAGMWIRFGVAFFYLIISPFVQAIVIWLSFIGQLFCIKVSKRTFEWTLLALHLLLVDYEIRN